MVTFVGLEVTVLAIGVVAGDRQTGINVVRVVVGVLRELEGSRATVITVTVIHVLVASTFGTGLELGILGQLALVTVVHGAVETGGGLEIEGLFSRTHLIRGLTSL